MHLWGLAVHRPPIEYLDLGPKGDSPHTTMGIMGYKSREHGTSKIYALPRSGKISVDALP